MSAILNVLSGTKNDIRDKKRYQSDISFLCPPIINLIKAQVYDKYVYMYICIYVYICIYISYISGSSRIYARIKLH